MEKILEVDSDKFLKIGVKWPPFINKKCPYIQLSAIRSLTDSMLNDESGIEGTHSFQPFS